MRSLPSDCVPICLDNTGNEGIIEFDELENVIPADINQRPEGKSGKNRQRQVFDDPLLQSLFKEFRDKILVFPPKKLLPPAVNPVR